jgi:hypothetical protein
LWIRLSKEKAQWENAFKAFESHLEESQAGDQQLLSLLDQEEEAISPETVVSEDVLNILIKDSESFFDNFSDSVTQFSKDGPINHMVRASSFISYDSIRKFNLFNYTY